MQTIGELCKRLLSNYDKDEPCAALIWVGEDVTEAYRQMHEYEEDEDGETELDDGYPTKEEISQVLADVEHHKDAELGITWFTIQSALRDVLEERK